CGGGCGLSWGGGGSGGVESRVAESEYGDRVDPVVRTTFGARRKIPPEKFSGGGCRNPVGEGGRRWGGMRGERERVDEDEVILFYNRINVPTRQILDYKGAIPTKTAADAKTVIQEMAEYSQKWHNGTSSKPEYLFRHTEGRKSGARLLEGHFIGRLAAHFGLVSDQGLRGLSVLASELPLIDLSAEDAPVADEGAQAVPAPVQAPQPPPPAPQHRTISITEQTRVSTWMISCMTQLMDASGRTYQAFDSTLVGSSHVPYQRRVRPRTGDASTFTAPHTDD
ncbi:hypothetical protein Tco_0854247, partial [Tanacetum coccineum]